MNDFYRAVFVGVVALAVLSSVATTGSVAAAGTTTNASDASSAQTTGENAPDDGGAAVTCSYRQTETKLAYEGSTAGVLDPRKEDKIPVLLGGFTDTSPTYNASQFEQAFFGTGTANVDGPGTLREYYLEVTDGMINLSAGPAGVNGWYETDMESDRILDSDKDTLDLTPNENSQFVRKVIEQADSDVDFSDYDNNNDGCVAIVVVYQGVDMRAHAAAPWGNFFKDADFNVDVDGVTVSAYARVKELYTNRSDVQTDEQEPIGTPAHEIGHLYGMPDLYAGGDGRDIGFWGLMAAGNYGYRWGNEKSGSSPVHPSAWTKLQLLQHPSPEINTLGEYRVTIPQSGRPGILPPATQNQYYRINPRSVSGCQACDGQYYLLGYRKLTGFDEGLRPTSSGNSSLRISRIDGPWDGDMVNDPSLIHGENRLNHFGNESFNASTSNLARLADGSDSGIDLRNFSTEHGMATFNDPPHRHLDANETAVFAVPVAQTLPGGTHVGSDYKIDHRVATNSTANMTVRMVPGYAEQNKPLSWLAHIRGQQFLRIDENDGERSNYGSGVKVIHETNQSVDYISATTYRTFPLPSKMSVGVDGTFDAIKNGDGTTTVDIRLTAAGEPYDYGQFGSPSASDFDVEIGGVSVDTANITLTEHDTANYTLEAELPTSKLTGYDVTVGFTENKGDIEHRVTGSEHMLQPILDRTPGDGSSQNPYQIRTVRQLQALGAHENATAELVTDIDATSTEDWFGDRGFVPIGNVSGRYPAGVNVTLDGNGHSISGLFIDRDTVKSTGLFAGIGPDGHVGNLTLENATLISDGPTGGAGTLAGTNRGRVDNVSVRGVTVETRISTTGGLVGQNTGVVNRSSVVGDVDGDSITGGLVGESTGTVGYSYAAVSVEGGRDAYDSTGGLIGSLETKPRRSTPAIVTHSFAVAEVEATSDVGGLVGTSFNGTIEHTYSQGTVTGERRVGSLAGLTNRKDGGGTVANSYAAAQVDAEGDGGNIWGETPLSTDSYWPSSIEAVSHGVNDTMLEPSQMKGDAARANMSKFDFENTWKTVEGAYPQLQWYDGTLGATKESATDASDDRTGTDTGDNGDDDDSNDTSGGSGPGMGVPVAVIALVLASLTLARRREE